MKTPLSNTNSKNAESYPEKLKRIAAEGHEIGNHTYSHVTAGKVSEGDFRRELEKAHDIIKKLTGVSPVLFRPPTGYCDAATVRSAARLSYKIIVWNVDTKDWMHTCAENIISNVSISARGGCIVLFHDYVSAPSPTPKALSVLIPSLMRSGYRFVTVSELISLDARKS